MSKERSDAAKRPLDRRVMPAAWVKYSVGAMPHFVPVINGSVTFQCSAIEALEYQPLYTVPDGCQIAPPEPTPEMLDALRTGSRKDWPSDELCRVRYAALMAAITRHNVEFSGDYEA